MKKLIETIFFILFTVNFATGQSCYVQMEDNTGIDRAQNQSQLEAVACELIQEFPTNFQSQFKVFDFGAYTLNEFMLGGFETLWEQAIQEAESQSPYYFIFGKQSDSTGIYTKFWIKIKLPSENEFSCFDNDFYTKIEFNVLQKVNKNYSLNKKNPSSYASAEIAGIQELKFWVTEIVNCCDPSLKEGSNLCNLCSWSTGEAVDYFSFNGFDQDSIQIISTIPAIDSECICLTDYDTIFTGSSGINYEVLKVAAINQFSLNQEDILILDLYNELKELAEIYGTSGFPFFGIISDNTILCSKNETITSKGILNTPTIDDIKNSFNANKIGIWIHIQYDNSTAILNVKTKGLGGNVLQNCNDYPQYCDKLSFVIDRLESTSNSFYNEINQKFCSKNSLDLIIKISDTGNEDSGGETSALKDVIRNKIVYIELNDDRFDENYFCDSNELGYLYIAKTIMHEGVHAIFARIAYDSKGNIPDEKKRNFKLYNYGNTYLFYRSKYPENYATFYTEHWLILKYFFRKITNTLYNYNNKFGDKQDYFYMTYNFQFQPTIPLVDFKAMTGFDDLNSVSEIITLMQSKNNNLKNQVGLPCQD